MFNGTSGCQADELISPFDSHKLLTADLTRRDWHLPFSLCPPTRSFPPCVEITLTLDVPCSEFKYRRALPVWIYNLTPLTFFPSFPILSFTLSDARSILALRLFQSPPYFCLNLIFFPPSHFIVLYFTQKHFIALHFQVTPLPFYSLII